MGMKQKKIFIFFPKWRTQKTEFFKTANSQYLFAKKKNLKNAFLTCFRPYLGQPDDRIG